MNPSGVPFCGVRRRWLAGLGALSLRPAWAQLPVADNDVPGIRALDEYVAGRTLAFGRVKLDIPRLADNGNAVPMRIAMPGPFLPTAPLRSIRLYSEKNPVPLMMRLDFPMAPPRAEIDSRIRLAGTQRVVAVAELGDGTLHAAVAAIVVTLAACLDGT